MSAILDFIGDVALLGSIAAAVVGVTQALIGIHKAGAALERIAARLDGPITVSFRRGDDDDGPEGEELDIPPAAAPAPPAGAGHASTACKVLN